MIRFRLLLLLLSLSLLGTSGCRKEQKQQVTQPDYSKKTTTFGSYTSEYPYNLNVVYFIPNDVTPPANYQKRISDITLYIQNFYKSEMARNGYPNTTFGLLKNPATNLIRMTVIYGAHPRTSYTYQQPGGNNILNEVKTYFTTHPGEKTSDHFFIITAADDKNYNYPFYSFAMAGLGKGGFGLDYPGFDLSLLTQNTADAQWMKTTISGITHELGHGLGLPHDRETTSDNAAYGISLMSAGATLGSSCMLTPAACDALSNSQVFSKIDYGSSYFYSGLNQATITNIKHAFTTASNTITIAGSFTSNAPVTKVVIYMDPEGGDTYDQVSFRATMNGSGNGFYLTTPISQLWTLTGNYTCLVALHFANGDASYTSYPFFFQDGKPVMAFATEFDRTPMSLVGSTPTEPGYPEINVLDGNPNTIWHSNWSSGTANYPYHMQIKLGSTLPLSGLKFTQRQNLSRSVKDIDVYTYSNAVGQWQFEGSYQLLNIINKQSISFSPSTYADYVHIVYKSSYDGGPWAAMADVAPY